MKSTAMLLLAFLLAPYDARAATNYPCPSDPGFCYRDVGDDGCFDAGPDSGPIDGEIESQSTFPAVPAAGSIVCPPSVVQLTATDGSIRLATPSGSSILFYGQTLRLGPFGDLQVVSGDAVLLDGKVLGAGLLNLVADGDVEFAGLFKQTTASGSATLESLTGNIIVDQKSSFKTHAAFIRAVAGDVTFEDRVVIKAVGGVDSLLYIEAAGNVELTRAKLTSDAANTGIGEVRITGANVSLFERTKIKARGEFNPSEVEIAAASGDIVIDQLSLNTNTPISISGDNVIIGTPKNGKVPPSRVTAKTAGVSFDIGASDAIDVSSLVLTTSTNVAIETTGASLNILNCNLKGKSTNPSITVSGGAGSTCDLTGTAVVKATVVTNCDTIVGP